MRHLRATSQARQDIAWALRRSEDSFGAQARSRYKRLIDQALRDLAAHPARAGVKAIDDVRVGYFACHVKSSAGPKPSVKRPRHLIAFFIDKSDDVIVVRVSRERQMLSRHIYR